MYWARIVFLINKPLLTGTGLAAPDDLISSRDSAKIMGSARLSIKTLVLVESRQHCLLVRAWDRSQNSCPSVGSCPSPEKGRERKKPFRLVFFRYLYTLECFSCSLANLHLNAHSSDMLKIVWLLRMLFGAVAVQWLWKSGSCCLALGFFYKISKRFCKGKQPFLQGIT